ncbi:MAG: four helix bundle protein [Pseudomonadota bacterium]
MSLKELRETQRWLKLIQSVPLIKKPELLDDILEETEELIKIFVTSIKTAEKKPRLGVVECLQNNLALMGGWASLPFMTFHSPNNIFGFSCLNRFRLPL